MPADLDPSEFMQDFHKKSHDLDSVFSRDKKVVHGDHYRMANVPLHGHWYVQVQLELVGSERGVKSYGWNVNVNQSTVGRVRRVQVYLCAPQASNYLSSSRLHQDDLESVRRLIVAVGALTRLKDPKCWFQLGSKEFQPTPLLDAMHPIILSIFKPLDTWEQKIAISNARMEDAAQVVYSLLRA